jgi:hypothetical protein
MELIPPETRLSNEFHKNPTGMVYNYWQPL